MDIKPISSVMEFSSSSVDRPTSQESCEEGNIEVDLDNLPSDPGLRPDIMSYPSHLIEKVRRAYLLRGPCQPYEHDFPQKMDGNRKRKFVSAWFVEFKDWLEYSIAKDAVFCLYCYLFSRLPGNGQDAFVSRGFSSWRKKERLRDHVGDHNSGHNRCRLECQDLMNQGRHIKLSLDEVSNYRCTLNTTIIFLRFLITQGLAFQGHDEAEESVNQENFFVVREAPDNLKLTSPEIRKDIINAAAFETINVVMLDIGNDYFSILVDECLNVSLKEQIGVIVRYVNKNGCVIERFLGLVHVGDTSAPSLEKGVVSLLSTYGLNISSLRGQGYNGASCLTSEFNELKSLILKRNPSAYYVHSFAHELQLTVIGVAKKNIHIGSFFNNIRRLCNVVGGSCEPRDPLRESQREKIIKCIETGKGFDQEIALKRLEDTHWVSHYGTLINLMHLFSSVLDVLEYVEENGTDNSQRAEAMNLLERISNFEFVFVLHLMKQILGITHELSQMLQRKDHDIVNAMNLVKVAKTRLQVMRDDGWEIMVAEVSKFCITNEIDVLDMEDEYVARRRGRYGNEKILNLRLYKVELYNCVIDMQLEELNQRFDEVSRELLSCIACFNPRDSFSAFDAKKLVRLAQFYPSEFSEVALYELESQLENFIFDVRLDERFSKVSAIEGIGGLAQKMVSTRKHEVFPLVYLLVKLSLILPVATATVERAFSAMKTVKECLRNHMGNELFNDCIVPYIEKDVFANVTNEAIVERLHAMVNERDML